MLTLNTRALLALLAAVAAVGVAACGGAGSSGTASDCLTGDEVQRQVDQIALGVEGSQAEVDQKQEAISAIRARACE